MSDLLDAHTLDNGRKQGKACEKGQPVVFVACMHGQVLSIKFLDRWRLRLPPCYPSRSSHLCQVTVNGQLVIYQFLWRATREWPRTIVHAGIDAYGSIRLDHTQTTPHVHRLPRAGEYLPKAPNILLPHLRSSCFLATCRLVQFPRLRA